MPNGLECVINVSEGRDLKLLSMLEQSCMHSLLDVHSDIYHNRSVFTLFGPSLYNDVKALTKAAVSNLNINSHDGVHPRYGVVDVVPFCPLGSTSFEDATTLRDTYARWLWKDLQVPSFLYGTGRSLPQIRRILRDNERAAPDIGHAPGHVTAGYCAVGTRPPLVAYNLIMNEPIDEIKELAQRLRDSNIKTLALEINGQSQLSTNLVNPKEIGPIELIRFVESTHQIKSTELVGLIPQEVIQNYTKSELDQSGIDESSTIEYRIIHQAGRPS